MSQRIKFTYNEAKSKCKDSGGKLAEPSENDNEELKSFQVFTSMFVLPYARHYNPRFVFFLAHFSFLLRFILQTIYVIKMEILHFLSLKFAAYTRERLLIKCGL